MPVGRTERGHRAIGRGQAAVRSRPVSRRAASRTARAGLGAGGTATDPMRSAFAFPAGEAPGRFLDKPYEGASRPIVVWLTPNVCAMTVRASPAPF
jgi:hypothetical protein